MYNSFEIALQQRRQAIALDRVEALEAERNAYLEQNGNSWQDHNQRQLEEMDHELNEAYDEAKVPHANRESL